MSKSDVGIKIDTEEVDRATLKVRALNQEITCCICNFDKLLEKAEKCDVGSIRRTLKGFKKLKKLLGVD